MLTLQAEEAKIYSQNPFKNVQPGGNRWGRWRLKDAWASLASQSRLIGEFSEWCRDFLRMTSQVASGLHIHVHTRFRD